MQCFIEFSQHCADLRLIVYAFRFKQIIIKNRFLLKSISWIAFNIAGLIMINIFCPITCFFCKDMTWNLCYQAIWIKYTFWNIKINASMSFQNTFKISSKTKTVQVFHHCLSPLNQCNYISTSQSILFLPPKFHSPGKAETMEVNNKNYFRLK